jgi:hypothetical protein
MWVAAQLALQPFLSVALLRISRAYKAVNLVAARNMRRKPFFRLRILVMSGLEEGIFHFALPQVLPQFAAAAVFAACHAATIPHVLQAYAFSIIQIQVAQHSLLAAWLLHATVNLVMVEMWARKFRISPC